MNVRVFLLAGGALVALMTGGLALLAGFGGAQSEILDVASLFRLHAAGLALLGGVALMALAWRRSLGRWAVVCGGGAAGVVVLAWLAGQPSFRPASGSASVCGESFRFATANLLISNQNFRNLIPALQRIDADVLVTQETSGAFWRQAGALRRLYPYRVARQRRPSGVYAVVLWSKYPLLGGAAGVMTPERPIFAKARVDLGAGGVVTVLGLHFAWPIIGAHRGQLAGVSTLRGSGGGPLVAMGDFNASRWSWAMARVGALTDARLVGGYRRTWAGPYPALFGLPQLPEPIGLQLDHILISEDLHPCAIWTEVLPGSDHRALVAEIALPTPEP